MTEKELRAKLEKVRNVTERAWRYLSERGYVEAAVYEEGEAQGRPFEYLLKEFDESKDAFRGGGASKKPPGRTQNEEKIPAQLDDYELERSRIFSEYVAKMAATTSTVQRFRRQILDGRLLSSEEARSFLRSPLTAHLSRDWFDAHGIRTVGHPYRVKESGKDKKGSYQLIAVADACSGNARRLKDRRPLEAGPWTVSDRRGRAREIDDVAREIKDYKVLSFPGEDGRTHRVLARSGSVLGYLQRQVGRLLKNYPWFESDAVLFMLTGEAPYVAPMTWRSKFKGHETFGPYPPAAFHYGLITLTVEPWISAKTVERVYRDIQQEMLEAGGRKGDNRSVGDKNRELFLFVTKRIGSIPLHPQEKRHVGKELVSEWNRRHPRWAYRNTAQRTATNAFWRDYNLARKLITTPQYKPLAAE